MSMLPPLMEQQQPSRAEIDEFMNAVNSIQSHCISIISLAQQWRTLQSSFNLAQASLEKHLEEVARKKVEMEEREKELSRRIEVAEAKGKLTREWHDQVQLVDKLLSERGVELGLKEVDLIRRFEALELREKEFEEKSMAFKTREKEFEEKSMAFEVKEKEFEEIEEKGMAFEVRRKEMEEKSMALEVRRKEIVEKGMALEVRSKKIEEKSMALEMRRKEIEEKGMSLEMRRKEIEEKSVALEVRRKEIVENSMAFEAIENDFEEKSMALEVRRKEIEEKSMALEVRRKEIEEKSRALEVRRKEIEEKSMSLEVRRKEFEEKSMSLETRRKEIEEKSRALEMRRKEFDKHWQGCELSEKVTISTVFGNSTNFCSEIESACTNMDANGVRSYLYPHVMYHKLFPQKVMDALKSAPDPAALVFEVLQSFNIPQSSTIDKTSCIFLLQQLMQLQKNQSVRNPFGDYQVSSPPLQITQDMRINALEFASIWQRRFTEQGLRPLDVYGFLQFVACYGLASLYDADELMQLFAVLYDAQPVYWPEENPQLCRALGLTSKIPGLITSLIEDDRRLQAAKYICTFMEEPNFPLALLLKDHVKFVQRRIEEIREMSKDISTGKIEVMFELSHLQEVLQYIKDYKLEQEFSPTTLESRIIQLEAMMANLKTVAP